MFKIYFVNSAYEKDQVLMYDDTRDDDGLKLGNPKLHIEVNAAGTLDFELPSTNVAYSRIIPMVTELHVIKDNQKTHDKHIWFGRVLTINTDLYGTKTIHCEGGLAYLNDCIYYDKSVDHGSWSNQKTVGRAIFARYESPTLNEGGVHVYGVSPNEASAVIANIMSGGSNYKENLNAPLKHLGRIAKDTDSDVPIYAWVNEPVVPSGDQTDDDYYFDEDNPKYAVQNQCGISNPNNMTAIDLISSMMSNVGGLFWVSKTPQYPKRTFGGANSGNAVYVMQLHMRRYYPAFNPDEGQTIQLGENLTDLTITDDGTTFFTAVHPHGQHTNSGEDFTLDHRGIQSGTTYVNKRNWKIDPGHGVMYCPELVKQYGMIIRDLDVGATNIYEQLVGMGISEIDKIPIISKTVGGSWTSGVRELTVKGIDLSLYNADYSSIELTDAVRVLAPRHGIDTYLNVTAIDYDLHNVENTVFTLNAIKTANEITEASPSYGSSSGPQSSGSSYVHPKHTEHDLGLYKFSNDNLGHVDSAVAVTKKDITALGIPGSIPIYNVDVDGEYGYSEGMIIATIVVNKTAHPIGVPIIGENENADYGLMSASDKTKLDGISDNANNYVHPTTSGNKHIPSGGASGQILRWSADGTAVWGDDKDTTYSDATQSTHGLMTAADKKKLDGMDLSKYLPKDGTAKKAELLSSGQMRSAYCHNDDATFSNGYVWFKIGTATLSGEYTTITTTFLGICGYGKHALYTARVRLTSAGNAVESISFSESGRTGVMRTGLFRIVAINGEKNVTFELWAKGANRWEGTKIVILNEMQLNGISQGNFWTLTSRGNADAKQNPTSGNMYVDSSDSSICATATKATEATTLTDSGWIDTTRNISFTEISEVKCRKYGQLVEVRGFVTFRDTYGSPVVCILPDEYCPKTAVQACGITPSGKQYMIKTGPHGILSFDSDSGSTFVKDTTYSIDLTYLLG